MTDGTSAYQECSTLFFPTFPCRPPSWPSKVAPGLPASSRALPVISRALSLGSKAHSASSEALLAVSETLPDVSEALTAVSETLAAGSSTLAAGHATLSKHLPTGSEHFPAGSRPLAALFYIIDLCPLWGGRHNSTLIELVEQRADHVRHGSHERTERCNTSYCTHLSICLGLLTMPL